MNRDWLLAALALIGLVFVPRFIAELAWSRRLRVKTPSGGGGRLSLIDRIRAQSPPWIVFGAIGVACASAALAMMVVR